MSVRFTIRSADLRRLRSTLHAFSHPDKEKQWIVFLEVTEWAGIFRFGEKTAQYPVDGQSPGFARFPEDAFWQVTGPLSERTSPKEVTVEILDGLLRCNSEHSAGKIEVGYFRDPGTGDVLYSSDAELAALGSLLADQSALGPQIERQIAEASDRVSLLISSAAHTLRTCGVNQQDISDLVHSRIAELKPLVRARFDSIGMNPWKS